MEIQKKNKGEGEPSAQQSSGQEQPSLPPIDKVFNKLLDKEFTQYDFWVTLKGIGYHTISKLKNEEGLNLLHMCVDKGRLSLITLLQIGWWVALSKEKVPDTSLSEHKGRNVRQIAESKRTRKPLEELNHFNEWENSLSPLMKAARQGDLASVKQILGIEGAKSHYRDTNNGNALYWAVVGGNKEVLQVLIDFGIDYTMKTKKGETLLHLACMLGQSHMIEWLVHVCHIDHTAKDLSHKTGFDRCAENGDTHSLIALFKCGLTFPKNVPVIAAFAGRMECLKYFLEELKIKVDSRDMYQRTPLHRAVEGGNHNIAKYLVENGADVTLITCSYQNVLHIAARSGNIPILHLLCEELDKTVKLEELLNMQDRYSGVDLCFLIRGRDRGRDAFHYVEVERHKVPIFLKKTKAGNVDVSNFGTVLTSGWGVNPEQDTIDHIEDMFKRRKQDNTQPLDQTPLHIAICKGNIETAKQLLQKGANVNIKDKFGQTPIMLAAAMGSLDIIKELESKGAEFEVGRLKSIAELNEQEDVTQYLERRNFSQRIIDDFCVQLGEQFVAGPLQTFRDAFEPGLITGLSEAEWRAYQREKLTELKTEIARVLNQLEGTEVTI